MKRSESTSETGQNSWQYDKDNGNVMCRCPKCGGRLVIGLYTYTNPYHYCPYCGTRLGEGRITEKRKEVYALTWEDEGRQISLETREEILNEKR